MKATASGLVGRWNKAGTRYLLDRGFGGSSHGYLQISATPQKVLVHRIICEKFHGLPPSPKHQVNHKNGIRTDNRPVNLEWVSSKENLRHAVKILKSRRRDRKFDRQHALSLLKQGKTQKEVAISRGFKA
jgi:hypothetical protein